MIHKLETTWPFGTQNISINGMDLSVRPYFLRVKSPERFGDFFVYVEQHEQKEYNVSGDVSEAHIKIKYCVIKNSGSCSSSLDFNYFDGYFKSHVTGPIASITGGAVFIDPESCRGLKIGSFFMNQVITWVKGFKNAAVNPIELSETQSYGDNKDRRNRFYEQFGIEFNFNCKDGLSGVSRPIMSHSLKSTNSWQQNIEVINHADIAKEIINQNLELSCLESQRRHAQDELDRICESPVINGLKLFFNKLFFRFHR